MHTDNKLLDGLRCEQIVIKWQKQIVKTLASLSFVSTVIRIIVHSASIMSVCGMYTDLKADCFHTFMIYRETAAIESKFDCLHSLAAPDCISWYLNVLFFCIAQGSNCSIDTSSHRNLKVFAFCCYFGRAITRILPLFRNIDDFIHSLRMWINAWLLLVNL